MMHYNKIDAITSAAFTALRGFVTPVDHILVADILDSMEDLGGIKLDDTGAEIVEMATRYMGDDKDCIRYICVNTIDSDVVISLILDVPDIPVKCMRDVLNPDGVLTYVYNATIPYFSELGYCFFGQDQRGKFRRIG